MSEAIKDPFAKKQKLYVDQSEHNVRQNLTQFFILPV